MNDHWDILWINANITPCDTNWQFLKEAALGIRGDEIVWLGLMQDLPKNALKEAKQVFDLKGQLITPGFIDCHTHLIYGGNRAHEFSARLQGKTYADIAKAGGGILKTVEETRALSLDELVAQSLPRLLALMQSGVTTVEIKSGYGLDVKTEIKMLQAAQQLSSLAPVTIKKTFLGAHTLPVEFAGDKDKYIHFICHEMLPRIAQEKLADAVDVFCENIAFNLIQTEKIFKEAQFFKLGIKCHAEQLSTTGAAILAARYGALSVDHLEYLREEEISSIKNAGTVAVLLPGAFYYLKEKQLPPVAAMRALGLPIAIASDCNPGTSPITSLLIILNMATVLFGLTIPEALQAVTIYAAKALGLEKTHGSIAIGKKADLAIWSVEGPADLVYYLGARPLKQLIKAGNLVKIGEVGWVERMRNPT